jgi:hypothetical protein
MHLTRRWARRAAAAALAAAAAAGAGCGTTFEVEGRETPVHVWIEAPSARGGPFVADLNVRVGETVVVDGPVRFPAGTTRVAVPPVYLRAGRRPVVVRGPGGRVLAEASAEIQFATWILVTVQGGQASIRVSEQEP